jgi:hypothetical protein
MTFLLFTSSSFWNKKKAAEEYKHRGYVSAIIKRVHKVVHRRREADTHNPKKHTHEMKVLVIILTDNSRGRSDGWTRRVGDIIKTL